MTAPADQVQIRPARPEDRSPILDLLRPVVEQRTILPRTRDELEDLLPTSFVAERAGQVVGFAALEVYSKKLAEIRGLVVLERCRGLGIGRELVAACIGLARSRGVMEVLAISSAETFFRGCGFDFTLPDQKKALFLRTGERR